MVCTSGTALLALNKIILCSSVFHCQDTLRQLSMLSCLSAPLSLSWKLTLSTGSQICFMNTAQSQVCLMNTLLEVKFVLLQNNAGWFPAYKINVTNWMTIIKMILQNIWHFPITKKPLLKKLFGSFNSKYDGSSCCAL